MPCERYKLFTLLLIVPRPQNKTISKIYDYKYSTKFIFLNIYSGSRRRLLEFKFYNGDDALNLVLTVIIHKTLNIMFTKYKRLYILL
jgi:hypothetical protein